MISLAGTENLQSGAVSCVDVLRTYQWKAIRAHEATNCVVMFVKEAEQWASDWDAKALEKDFVKPTFFGIPISLKECVPLEGYDQTRGFAQDVNSPTKIDSVLVKQIKKLGTTNNPLDKERTPGGSSGGESAMIAAGGSIIGRDFRVCCFGLCIVLRKMKEKLRFAYNRIGGTTTFR
ncbi:unnamed protein product [Heligmosomoides polygyrus]|uniref:Amidase domain-containing protein n=1 Tax=Heligmosomoides polygyrus TaxID=6339 RepID=A0A183F303_HELPZ|nr:unnamed protein product [Heligmosomoides polygyrus]